VHSSKGRPGGGERICSGCPGPDDAGGVHLTKKEIESLREDIDRIDSEILSLVVKREEVAVELGLTKEREGLELRDRRREKQVIEQFVRKARAFNVDPVFASILAELLISDALRSQKSRRSKPLREKRAVVVGGSGRMGEWFCRFLSNRGASVTVWDPRGRLEGYPNERSPGNHVRDSDIVVIASPLGVSQKDLDAVLACRPRGLVFDVCSVKSHISKSLRGAAKDGATITSIHPMFGPGVPSPRGLNVLVCDCGCTRANDQAERIFASAGANVTVLGLKDHDELMAYVLGLPHLCTLLFSNAASKSGHSFKELRQVQGPSFERLSKGARELAGESKRVYHDIQALNPNTEKMIASLERTVNALMKASLETKPTQFSRIMKSNKHYLEVN
jgi:chorismate mutase/prephenate dehydrogenase